MSNMFDTSQICFEAYNQSCKIAKTATLLKIFFLASAYS